MARAAAGTAGPIVINPPEIRTLTFTIEGDAPYVQLRFSQKQKNKLKDLHAKDEKDAGAERKKTHTPKDYDALFIEAMYESDDGRRGLNALSFKSAMVRASSLTKMPMSLAKLSLFVVPDGFDAFEPEIPMIFFTKGEPEELDSVCRNANGMPDLRIRAMWAAGWQARVRVNYDAGVLSRDSVIAIMTRAGMQVGVGEGRPASKKSDGAGMGWGTFVIAGVEDERG